MKKINVKREEELIDQKLVKRTTGKSGIDEGTAVSRERERDRESEGEKKWKFEQERKRDRDKNR